MTGPSRILGAAAVVVALSVAGCASEEPCRTAWDWSASDRFPRWRCRPPSCPPPPRQRGPVGPGYGRLARLHPDAQRRRGATRPTAAAGPRRNQGV